MARCDEGYLCDVCGEAVADMADSDLYLHFVLGQIPYTDLHRHPERHIRCNPSEAQYIVDDAFPAVEVDGVFDKRQLDAEFVQSQETRYTRAWRRLQEVSTLELPISEYPLVD